MKSLEDQFSKPFQLAGSIESKLFDRDSEEALASIKKEQESKAAAKSMDLWFVPTLAVTDAHGLIWYGTEKLRKLGKKVRRFFARGGGAEHLPSGNGEHGADPGGIYGIEEHPCKRAVGPDLRQSKGQADNPATGAEATFLLQRLGDDDESLLNLSPPPMRLCQQPKNIGLPYSCSHRPKISQSPVHLLDAVT